MIAHTHVQKTLNSRQCRREYLGILSYSRIQYRRRCIVIRLLFDNNSHTHTHHTKLKTFHFNFAITTYNTVHLDYWDGINERKSFQSNTSGYNTWSKMEKNKQSAKRLNQKREERQKTHTRLHSTHAHIDKVSSSEAINQTLTLKRLRKVFE